MEQLLFGGVSHYLPYKSPGGSENVPGVPPSIALVFGINPMPGRGHPSPGTQNNAFAQPGALTTVFHPSSIWVSRLLSERFWGTGAGKDARKSDNCFWRHPLLRGQTPNVEANTVPMQWLSPILQYHATWSREGDDLAGSEVEMERNMYNIAYRNGVYASLRMQWSNSPWAECNMRDSYRHFPDAFHRKDEITCVKVAMDLVNLCTWDVDENTYFDSLPSSTDVKPEWAWHCLGLLMLASLPIRRTTLQPHVKSKTKALTTFTPSAEATAAGDAAPVSISMTIEEKKEIEQSVLYGRVGNDWDRIEPRTITRRKYMKRLQAILDDLIKTSECIIHRAFFLAITQTYLAVDNMTAQLMYDYENDADEFRWLPDWNFDMPEYDPTLVRYSNVLNTFVEVNIPP
ncbi:hypothetical protein F5Y18DRAFT_427838 [Xylariaceae sp. FL1019]|nr:hypothetical protein F5Y18DRAFT_427838 [Xylariaceae sp. FL1019]